METSQLIRLTNWLLNDGHMVVLIKANSQQQKKHAQSKQLKQQKDTLF